MYEIFGLFDSSEEINRAADGLKNEGDIESVFVLAKENGIGEEFVQAYIDGDIQVLVDPFTAAVGRIEVERKSEIDQMFELMKDDVINYILNSCDEESFAVAVRKKNKSLKECFEHIQTEAYKRIGKKAGVLRDREVYEMARNYYLSGGDEA